MKGQGPQPGLISGWAGGQEENQAEKGMALTLHSLFEITHSQGYQILKILP